MRTFNEIFREERAFSEYYSAGSIVPVFTKKGRRISKSYAILPKQHHLQYSKAVATLCDAVQEYGDFLGSVVAKEKYDKAISAVRNLQAQAVIQSNMAI